ncbi:DFM1 (YDR411C) [Zygosaccharomyces parabailii]|nr:DFM1 (YDR411C) [Zygosaccharomyces parabailii]CDH11969.1 related to DER1-like family member protein 1 [Zygosaccharomyces bailii ISA1307]
MNSTHNNTGPLQVWKDIPVVTRCLISSIVIITTLNRLELLSTGRLVYQFNEVASHFQLWRIFTSCIILPMQAMPAMLEMYNFYSRSSQLESRRDSHDYAFYLCFCIITICATVTVLFGRGHTLILTGAFASCLTYTWSVDNANVKVMFYGLFPIWGKYFPLIQLFIAFVFGEDNFAVHLVGFLTAYLYLCLDTRTCGPIVGWLFFGENPQYGISPNGYFGAPHWIKRARRDFTSSSNGRGQKLGYRTEIKKEPAQGTASRTSVNARAAARRAAVLRENVEDTVSGSRTSGTTAKQRSSSGFFPGHGQRLGA